MSEQSEAKRARQACLNCRRKKSKCPGERPTCSFCIRLGQPCTYPGSRRRPRESSTSGAGNDSGIQKELMARVAELETRLDAQMTRTKPPSLDNPSSVSDDASMRSERSNASPTARVNTESDVMGGAARTHSQAPATTTSKFLSTPPIPVLQSFVDAYFANCQGQPYSFFHEASFRMRFSAGEVSETVLLAMAASAARYSNHPYLENRQVEATQHFSRRAWKSILQQAFTSEHGLDLSVAQATSLLAIIDFTAGQNHLGWVKIGLAIRFVQGLRLNAEPDQGLPSSEQEERRRVFWSVYILDKFVTICTGRGKSPALLDIDCTVKLPCSEDSFRSEHLTDMPTLSTLTGANNIDECRNLDFFTLLVLMCSTLSRTIRCALHQVSAKPHPPWDYRSDFAKVSSSLFTFERLHASGENLLGLHIAETLCEPTTGQIDRQRAGGFVWSRGVYHLCGSMLYHPLLMAAYRGKHPTDMPASFAREALRRGQVHAEALTDVIRTVQETACCARGSFLGFFASVAASIHLIYSHNTDATAAVRASKLRDECLAFLEAPPVCWQSYKRIATALRDIEIDPPTARILSDVTLSTAYVETSTLDRLWLLMDYDWLCDSNPDRSNERPSLFSSLASGLGDWALLDGLMAMDGDFSFSPRAMGIEDAFASNISPLF